MATTLTKADDRVAVGHAARITHVSKSFAGPAGTQLVLDDISLDVAPGEFVTLLGASGCGKSTLLNLVAGLDRPTGGTIETPGGRPALMFKEHALFPWLTAGKNRQASSSSWSASKASRTIIRANCRAACASAPRLPARSPSIRRSC